MTAVPFKLRALRNLTDCLKSITRDAGYMHDLADVAAADGVVQPSVFRGRAWFGADDPIPMLSVLEATDSEELLVEPNFMSRATVAGFNWFLLIQGFVNDDPLNPTDPAYLLLADVRRRLALEKQRRSEQSARRPDILGLGLGVNRIEDLTFGTGTARPADDVSAKAYFWLPVALQVVEHADRPFD